MGVILGTKVAIPGTTPTRTHLTSLSFRHLWASVRNSRALHMSSDLRG